MRPTLLPLLAAALLAAPARAVIVTNVAELLAAIDAANRGGDRTILVQDGTYVVPRTLVITATGVTIRGLSGDRTAVAIFGPGMQGSVRVLFLVQGSDCTLQDLTLGRVNAHAVQVQGEQNASGTVLLDLRIQDTYEQMVKISYDAQSPNRSRDGRLEGCLLEYTAGIGPQFYIGGIDGHFTKDWVVRGNTFRGIKSPGGGLAEHAVHFWSGAEGTVVVGNRIVDCDRGIGFGLGSRGHVGGRICNNMIWHGGQGPYADVGIGLENASNVLVAHNTVLLQGYPNAIEYRFAGTSGGSIVSNLCNGAIAARDGGSASLQGNVTNASTGWFVAASSGDLHLASAVAAVVDRGVAVAAVVDDFDGEPRPLGGGVDVGADEWAVQAAQYAPFGSGCGGALEPRLRALQLPWLGHRFAIEVDNVGGSAGVVLLTGWSRTQAGSVPLPLDLSSRGMPGCFLRQSSEAAVLLPVAASTASWGLQLPTLPALLGQRLYQQALALQPAANAAGVLASAGAELRLGG